MARVAILTASDKGAAGERADISGDLILRRLEEGRHLLVGRVIVPDDRQAIADALAAWCDADLADLIITTGGTGLTARDVTPEATRDIAERDVPGIPVALWMEGLKKTPFAVLSRGVAVKPTNIAVASHARVMRRYDRFSSPQCSSSMTTKSNLARRRADVRRVAVCRVVYTTDARMFSSRASRSFAPPPSRPTLSPAPS